MISKLNDLIDNKYKVKCSGSTYTIEEKAEKDFPKTYFQVNGQSILFKFDDDKKLLHFFNDIPKAKSMADYVLFVKHKNIIHAFIIELKTSKKSTEQHYATELFINYIEKTAKRCFKLSGECVHRNVIVMKKVAYKKPTKSAKPFSKNNLESLRAGNSFDFLLYCVN